MVRLAILGRLDGLNDYTKACRTNKFAGARMKRDNELWVCHFINEQLNGKAFNKVAIRFNWYEENRRRDPDNIAFAKKFILDALVAKGVIPNDTQKHIEHFEDYFYVDKKEPRIEVLIKEV